MPTGYNVTKASWLRLLKAAVACVGGWAGSEGLLALAPILDAAPEWLPVALVTGAIMGAAKYLRNKWPEWFGWLKFV